MLQGLNHITFAVRDLDRSVDFYTHVLSGELKVKWDQGSYLSIGGIWICLTLDSTASPASGYSHIAFGIDSIDLVAFEERLSNWDVDIWKYNKSEGDSLYFLDPDGHKLEVHVGDLQSRIRSLQIAPYSGQKLFLDD